MEYKKTSHVIHLILSFLTGGLWLPFWVVCALSNAQHNKRVELNILQQQLEEMKRDYRRK